MQKPAYEMRISDWSSDVCSSYLEAPEAVDLGALGRAALERRRDDITVVRQRVIDQPVERGIGRGRGVGQVIGEIAPDLIARRLAPHHPDEVEQQPEGDRKSTRLNSSH